mmetsp:Transcript_28181/g.61217  ORF Transcript_28181/g.61217 Transcript_28181/m.61217 type:complete len:238 (-) Transcript_28181:1743-2456(-)
MLHSTLLTAVGERCVGDLGVGGLVPLYQSCEHAVPSSNRSRPCSRRCWGQLAIRNRLCRASCTQVPRHRRCFIGIHAVHVVLVATIIWHSSHLYMCWKGGVERGACSCSSPLADHLLFSQDPQALRDVKKQFEAELFLKATFLNSLGLPCSSMHLRPARPPDKAPVRAQRRPGIGGLATPQPLRTSEVNDEPTKQSEDRPASCQNYHHIAEPREISFSFVVVYSKAQDNAQHQSEAK